MAQSLEEAFDELIAQDPPPPDEVWLQTIKKYAPKNFQDWAPLLRKVADWIEAQPKIELLTAKQVGALISLVQFEFKGGK